MHSGRPDTPSGEIVVYETPDRQVRVDVRLERDRASRCR
jgi:hypothetical protein